MSEFNNLEKPDEIKLLKFPESVRNRIGMYLGGTDSTDQLLNEIVSNSIDESYISADVIIIDRDMNGFNCVADNGRGISIEYSDIVRDGSPIIQADLSISEIHSGSKFMDNKNATIGMFGTGSSAVNAVSENYILMSKITPLNYDKSIKEVYDLWESSGPRSKKDLFYIVWYKKGYKYFEGAMKKSDIEKMVFTGSGKKKSKTVYKELPTGMSTIVLYQPDPEIFEEKALKANLPIQNLKYFLLIQEKFYKKKVTIDLEGTTITSADFDKYQFEFTKRIIPEDTSSNEYVDLYVTFEVDPTLGARVYNGSVNSLSVDSGVHITYLESCFAEAIKAEFGVKHKYLTNGLKLCVVILASETIFNSQIKEKLKSITKVKPSDFGPAIKEFQKIFRKNPDYWADYVGKLNYYADSMKHLGAAEKAQKMIDAASGNQVYRNKSGFIDSFSDATATGADRWNCELFICFTGDTEILTCNNEKINFVDLTRRIEAGEDIYTFSCTSDGRIVPAKIIRSEIKKEVNDLCKVTLDNGESFKCTPDHKIMMRDGTYKEAKDLVPEDYLMSYIIINNTWKIHSYKVDHIDFLLTINEPVYCLEVDAAEHNFPLAAGVFVKNCEGRSPWGSLKAGRKDARHIACLGLRGKVLNTTDKTADEMLRNAELESIFKAIGLGLDVNNVTSDCQTPEEAYKKIQEKSRYGKICISCDADSDGSQIANLLIYAFSKYARFLIDFGLVYYVLSPIYEQAGKYYYPNDPRVPGTDFPVGLDPKKPYHRYKGLGSLNKEDIYDVFYNPATRRLVQITPEGIDYSMGLMEDINNRKALLYEEGILSNPYNFLDL